MAAGWMREDPLSGPPDSDAYWTTVNAGEAIQGVPSPLSYNWFHVAGELGLRQCFADLGVFPRSAGELPEADDERFVGIFLGRMVINVDTWRRVGDLMPGTSADAIEMQFFGSVRPGLTARPSIRRYPFIAIGFPVSLYLKQKRVKELRAENARWRQEKLAELEGAGLEQALAVLDDAFAHFKRVVRHHVAASLLSQSLYDQLGKLCASTERPGLEHDLTTGYGSLEEGAVLGELWDRARSRAALEPLAERYGYYGVNSGEMQSPSWREDLAAVESLAAKYRTLDEEKSPHKLDARQQAKRRQAEAELIAALPAVKRPPARLLIRLASVYLPLRETGRAALLMANDVGRAAARIAEARLISAGQLAEPGDIFHLTHDEIVSRQIDHEVVVRRRGYRERYRTLELPEAWQGVPEPREAATHDDAVDLVVEGLAANAGVVEGIVRVVEDSGSDIEPGEILVCKTTDPSWASLLLIAGAAVIDIGGPLSHGAIVARELGIPCVINTKDGTRRLHTGDVVRVDGVNGRVERIAVAEVTS